MKKLFTLFVITALVVSTGIVGCGGGDANKTSKPDTGGKKAPTMTEKDKTTKDEAGGRKKETAGGQAKAASPPE